MSAATEFAPVREPAGVPPSRRPRHLTAVPAWSPAPTVPAARSAPVPPSGVAVLHAPSRIAPAAAPLRLTARGVVALAGLVAVLAGALLWIAASSAPDAGGAGADAGAGVPSAVTVEAGDTLWSIAGRVAPGRDPRAEVDALRRANHLAGVDIVPGQRLRVP